MSDEEDFVFFGKKFSDQTNQGKIKHIQDEIVVDDQGRRRFHGAFTGGFSAGYYNTVGSKEGFTPASFTSSRSKRNEGQKSSVEMFMDAEDISAFGIAPKNIGKSSEYEKESKSKDAIRNIMTVNRDSKGIKLMKEMGWRPGFNLGPRLQVAKTKANKKVYTCAPPPGLKQEADDAEEEEEEEEDVYAVGLYMLRRSTGGNRLEVHTSERGLDYQGISSGILPTAAGQGSTVAGFRGEAFGIGAMEEKEEYGVYDTDSIANYDKFITDEDTSSDFHSTHLYKSTRTNYLRNFVESGKEGRYTRKCYAPPVLPPGYKPWHTPTVAPQPPRSTSDPTRTVEERAAVLGNTSSADKRPGFKPYAKDEKKHKRYSEYVKTRTVNYTNSNLTEWEQNQELEEFSKAVKFFRPLIGELANKFVSAGTDVEGDRRRELEAAADKERSQAVNMKMFGRLTRETHEWCPASLLCKRFDVANPYPHKQTVGTLRRFGSIFVTPVAPTPVVAKESPSENNTAPANTPSTPLASTLVATPAGTSVTTPVGTSVVAPAGTSAPAPVNTSSTPSDPAGKTLESTVEENLDLFKSIFADSDDDADEESDHAESIKKETEEEKQGEDNSTSKRDSNPPENAPTDKRDEQPVEIKEESRDTADGTSVTSLSTRAETTCELKPVTVPLPPQPVIFNRERYTKNKQDEDADLDRKLIEHIKSMPSDSGLVKKTKQKKDKKKRKKEKKKRKKEKKKKAKEYDSDTGRSRSYSRSRERSRSSRSESRGSRSRDRSRNVYRSSSRSHSRSKSRDYYRSRRHSRSRSHDRSRSRDNYASRDRSQSRERARDVTMFKREVNLPRPTLPLSQRLGRRNPHQVKQNIRNQYNQNGLKKNSGPAQKSVTTAASAQSSKGGLSGDPEKHTSRGGAGATTSQPTVSSVGGGAPNRDEVSLKRKAEPEKKPNYIPKRARAIDFMD